MRPKYLLMAVCMVVSGCAVVRTAVFQKHDDSYKLKDQEVTVQIIQSGSKEPLDLTFLHGPPDDVLKECGITVQPKKSDEGANAAVVALAPFVLMAASIAVNELSGELKGYVEGQKATFSKSYGASVNIAPISFDGSDEKTHCIRVTRSITPDEDDPDRNPIAFDFVVKLERAVPPNNTKTAADNALLLRPIYLLLRKSAAKTSETAGAVDLDIAIGISVIKNIAKQYELVPLTQKNFAYAGVRLPSKFIFSDPESKKLLVDSAIFPLPNNPIVTAATIAVAIQETGSGADDFGSASKSIEANTGAINNAVDGYLKDRLK